MKEIIKSYKTELNPNKKQREYLTGACGAARFVYNWGLDQAIKHYEETKKYIGICELSRRLTQLKKEEKYSWLSSYSDVTFRNALWNLDGAFKRYFDSQKKDKNVGYPKFKSKKHEGSFTEVYIKVTPTHIKLPKIGWIRLKQYGYLPTENVKICEATVSEKCGRWFVSVQVRENIPEYQGSGEPIGIDLGLKDLVVISDGRKIENPKHYKRCLKRIKYRQKQLERRKKGSKNREKARFRLAKAYYKLSNIKKDFLHKLTSLIVAKAKPPEERPSAIVMENLNVSGMLKNHCLAQSIWDASFYEIKRQLQYKCDWYGIRFIVADRFYPSSKTCSKCGLINESLTLDQRVWTCECCGTEHDRDINAARNLQRLAFSTARSAGFKACGETPVRGSMKQEELKLRPIEPKRNSLCLSPEFSIHWGFLLPHALPSLVLEKV